jgi:lipopolysaccharide/colanic/teichoic acid biosynthesis glycosyltransferase
MSLFERSMPLWKRTLDVTGALFGLALLAPLFLVIAAAIKLTSRGPVFFGQGGGTCRLVTGRAGKHAFHVQVSLQLMPTH